MSKTVYICSAKRTAVGSFLGSLEKTPATELASETIKANLLETSIKKVDEVILGCVLTAGLGQAPARQALVSSGLPKHTSALTINKVCSSGLKAVMLASNNIALGQTESAIAGGMESMSLAPFLLPDQRSGAKLGNSKCIDSIVHDGLWDVYNNYHMGSAAELCARTYKLSREEQDAFAIESYNKARKAISAGLFKNEIVPIKVGKKETVFDTDEEPGRAKFEKIPQLKPAFDKDGTVTAANASSLNDGAATLLLCSEEFARKNSLTPLARIVAQAEHSQEPEWFTTAPVKAVEKVLKNTNKGVADLDLLELNEAFSAVSLACTADLKIDPARVNVHGGAVAIGHPIGASGARILTTLVHALIQRKEKIGVAALCNGGGEATALMIERI